MARSMALEREERQRVASLARSSRASGLRVMQTVGRARTARARAVI
jgi:hypothetical protein